MKMASASKIDKLATDLLLEDSKGGFKNGNFLCSPMSLEIILSMVAWGAKGRTLEQILGFLGMKSLSELYVGTPSMKLLAQLLSYDITEGGPDISIANAVFVDDRFPIFSSYQEILDKIYKAQATAVDFCNKNEAARKINSWASEKTNGLIKEIMQPDCIHRDMMTVLGNALYFKGLWKTAFTATSKDRFHLINGKTVLIPFMTSSKEFLYGTHDGIKILEAPYKHGLNSERFAMYFFLPEEKDGFQTMIEKFDSDATLFQRKFGLKLVRFDKLLIPKFKFSRRFEPQNAMEEMGLTLPFCPENKELTGIVDHQDGNLLYISNIIQEAFIDVNEKGTEAVSVTTFATRIGRRPPPPRRPSFVADRPFLFMIREKNLGATLFIGAVLNPKI